MPRYCEEEDCKNRARYNYVDLKSKFCFAHKKENMINVEKRKYCVKCRKTYPVFNYNGLKPLYCNIKGVLVVIKKFQFLTLLDLNQSIVMLVKKKK